MTREELLAKYPLPWDFQQTDRDGAGVIASSSSGQIMFRLATDQDWKENLDDPSIEDADLTLEHLKERPVFCESDEEESAAALEYLLAQLNGA